MKKLALFTLLATSLAAHRAPPAGAASSTFVNTANPGDGLLGYHVYGIEANSRGFSLDFDDTSTNPSHLGWSLGTERTNGDLYLFNYNYYNNNTLTATNVMPFRLRGDTGQIELGPTVGHPASAAQLNITAGTTGAPLTGIRTAVFGDRPGLSVIQAGGTTVRAKINFNNLFHVGTDMGNANVADFYIADTTPTLRYPLWISAQTSSTPDVVNLPYGATITGTATVNGLASLNSGATITGNLLQSAGQVGFFGVPAAGQQTVTGCRSDGTALASLLTALKNLGLIVDHTTP